MINYKIKIKLKISKKINYLRIKNHVNAHRARRNVRCLKKLSINEKIIQKRAITRHAHKKFTQDTKPCRHYFARLNMKYTNFLKKSKTQKSR